MSSRMYQTSTSPWAWRPSGAGAGRGLPKAPERCRRQVSLVVVGDMGCGKTTLSVRFCSGTFLQVQNTVGYDFHVRTVAARDGRLVQVRIWDTAGQERHRALAPVLFRGVHGCMLVYDCTRAASFAHVPLWAETLLSMTRSPVPRVLVGNKTDVAETERQVALEEGAALARDLGAARFYETSAVDGANVEAAFLALVDAVLAADDAADAAKAAATSARQPARQPEAPLRLQDGEEHQAARRRSCAC